MPRLDSIYFNLTAIIATSALKTCLHSGSLFLAAAISILLISPIQMAFIPELATHPILIFLPFGVRIVSAFFEGWMSIFYLLPAALSISIIFFGGDLNDAQTWVNLMVVYATPPLVFNLLDWEKFRGQQEVFSLRSWRTLLVAGIISAVVTSLLLHIVTFRSLYFTETLWSMALYVLGDLMGLVVLLLSGALISRAVLAK